MLTIVLAASLAALGLGASGTGAGERVAAPQQDYAVVPVAADERSGRSRQIRCSVGQMEATACTFTPLFGDGSFQLDGRDIAVRMIIDNGEGYLFEVFGPDHRVPVGSTYIRNPRDRACWIATDGGPSPVCAR